MRRSAYELSRATVNPIKSKIGYTWYAFFRYYDENDREFQIKRALQLKFVPKHKLNGRRPTKFDALPSNLREAETLAAQKYEAAVKDLSKKRERKLEKTNPYFDDFCKEYLERLADPKAHTRINTYNAYKSITQPLIVYFGKHRVKIREINKNHIREYLNSEKTNEKKNLAKKYTQFIKLLRIAYDLELINTVPKLPKSEIPKIHHLKRKEVLTLDQYHMLIEVAEGHRLRPYIIIAGNTGARREEIMGLCWDSVDFINRTITIKQVVTQWGSEVTRENDVKSAASERVIPISEEFTNYLTLLKEAQKQDKIDLGRAYTKSDYVIRERDGSMIKPANITAGLKYLSEKIAKNKPGFPRVTPYVIRHSVNAWMETFGVSISDRAYIMGHKVGTQPIYMHHNAEAIRGHIEQLNCCNTNKFII